MQRNALLVIDVQNDFCSGGSLAVPDGDAVVPVINDLVAKHRWDAIILTQDWHPADHVSFASNHPGSALFSVIELPDLGKQVLWPPHCVQGTVGAAFHPSLTLHGVTHAGEVVDTLPKREMYIVRKGTNRRVDSYSGFGDAHDHKFERTPLDDYLKSHGITDVFVTGLATDYCVAYTCMDAIGAGYRVHLITDACRGISDDSVRTALNGLEAAGVSLETTAGISVA